MFTSKAKNETSDLQEIIDELQTALRRMAPGSREYASIMADLVALYKLKEQETPKRLSADTKAIIISNLAGIVLILGYERAHIVTSKALSFVTKLR